MRVAIVTLFPELFAPFLQTSVVGRAAASGLLFVHIEELRRYGLGKHRSVDDTPYGGGSGMVMRVDCVVAAIEGAEQALGGRSDRVLLTPQGAPLVHDSVRELASSPMLTLVCGRYEGFDERVRSFVDREVSLGDYVLAGGETAAMVVVEACTRHLPGALGNEDSKREESFSEDLDGLLEYPQYTRPQSFRELSVPEVLRGGDHGKIDEWRRDQARARTQTRRPELLPGGGRGPSTR